MPNLSWLRQGRRLPALMVLAHVAHLVLGLLLVGRPTRAELPLHLGFAAAFGLLVVGLAPALAGCLGRLTPWLGQNERWGPVLLTVPALVLGLMYVRWHRDYPDEHHLFAAARVVAEEGWHPFFAAYAKFPWLGIQHPPLMSLLDGFVMTLVGPDPRIPRLVTLAFGTATVVVTYFLGRDLYDRATGALAALLLPTLQWFVRLEAYGTNDVPVTFFFALALLLVVRLDRSPGRGPAGLAARAAGAGLVVGLGLLCKYTMVLVYPVLWSRLLGAPDPRRLALWLAVTTLVSAGILAAWLAYGHHLGVLAAQREQVLSYAGVVTSSRYGIGFPFWMVFGHLPKGLGLYPLPLLLLGGLRLCPRESRSDRFVLIVLGLVFLPLLLTLPDVRYFLPCFPALAVVAARGLLWAPQAVASAVVLAIGFCAFSVGLYTPG
jgi:4-amino-4-deoxy-L-arabinose transferase-like glycosyltransferase